MAIYAAIHNLCDLKDIDNPVGQFIIKRNPQCIRHFVEKLYEYNEIVHITSFFRMACFNVNCIMIIITKKLYTSSRWFRLYADSQILINFFKPRTVNRLLNSMKGSWLSVNQCHMSICWMHLIIMKIIFLSANLVAS